MSSVVTKTETISAHPTSYDTVNYSYASISTSYPIGNAYADSDSTSYAQVNWKTGSNAETYVYMKFDFSSIPEGATISSVSASAKAYVNTTTASRVTNREMQLAAGTTLKGSSLTIGSTTTSQSFSTVGSWTRAELLTAGVRFYVKRGTSNTTSSYQLRIYGATMTVTYTYQETLYTITVNNGTSAVVTAEPSSVPSGEDSILHADTVTGITITDNNVDITNQFITGQGGTASSYPASYDTGGSINGTYYQQAIGKGSDTANTTGNDYFSTTQGASGSTWIDYFFNFSSIPEAATIASMSVTVKGHGENMSQSRQIANVQLYSGTTAKGTDTDFDSTTDKVYTINAGTWTRSELDDAKLRFTIGVYGGRISGVTWSVTYEMNGYFYTISNVSTDHIVVVSASGSQPTLYFKDANNWISAVTVYKKVNGSWVVQSNLSNVFSSGVNYRRGS